MFNNLTVKARLFFLIGLMSVIMLTLTGVNLYALNKTNQALQSVYNDRTLPIADLAEIKSKQIDIRLKVANAIKDPTETTMSLEKIIKTRAEIDKLWGEYAATELTPDEKILADKFVAARKTYINEAINPVLELLKKGDSEAAQLLVIQKVRPLFVPISDGINALVQLQKDVAQEEFDAAQSRFHTMLITSTVMLVLGLIASVFIGMRIVSSLIRELGGEPSYAAEVVKKIANGQLSTTVTVQYDDNSSLLYSINKMRQTLSDIIHDTSNVMSDVARGELGSQMSVEVEGDFIQLKHSINETIIQLRVTLFALNDVMYALYNADFAKTISGNVKGKFKDTLDRAMQTQNALREMLSDIGQVMEKVAIGEINHRVTAEGRGEMLALKNNINHTLVALESLNEIVRVANALAQGDLTQSIPTSYPGIFGQVTVSMNNTAARLKSLIGEVHEAVEMISTAAKEIAAGNNDLSHRTEEQAASLEETSASMQELTGTVQQNNTHAEDANRMANDAASIATRGVDVVNSVVTTMNEINNSSHRIVDIISVIDDIAFQTNILALNAAVEAARAGDSGKGFAVVAIEVRNLAQRAANAAGEIKRLIGDSVERISGGSKQVADAGQTMQEIVNSIRGVSVIINEITTASEEQSAGISQVNQAIRQMDDVTQQNAALVEQAAAAAESLEEQTRSLALEMANFKIR
jgi:methyl-accepting chemotaxis protein